MWSGPSTRTIQAQRNVDWISCNIDIYFVPTAHKGVQAVLPRAGSYGRWETTSRQGRSRAAKPVPAHQGTEPSAGNNAIKVERQIVFDVQCFRLTPYHQVRGKDSEENSQEDSQQAVSPREPEKEERVHRWPGKQVSTFVPEQTDRKMERIKINAEVALLIKSLGSLDCSVFNILENLLIWKVW